MILTKKKIHPAYLMLEMLKINKQKNNQINKEIKI